MSDGRTYEVLDYLDGNFYIPDDGIELDIEGFESDSGDDFGAIKSLTRLFRS